MTQMLSPILARSTGENGYEAVVFRCPGCGDTHQIPIAASSGPVWQYNGNAERPTLTPSINATSGCAKELGYVGSCWCKPDDPDFLDPALCYRCHSWVRDGMIEFLGDCTHALAGQTVPIPVYKKAAP